MSTNTKLAALVRELIDHAFNDGQEGLESPSQETLAAESEVLEALAAHDAEQESVALSDERIDAIAGLVVKGMPDGIQGFLKTWGWRQFARALLEDCAGHCRAPAEQAAQAVPAGWKLAQQSERDAILARLEAVPVPEPFSWPTTGHGGRFVSAEGLNDYRAAMLAAAKGDTK